MYTWVWSHVFEAMAHASVHIPKGQWLSLHQQSLPGSSSFASGRPQGALPCPRWSFHWFSLMLDLCGKPQFLWTRVWKGHSTSRSQLFIALLLPTSSYVLSAPLFCGFPELWMGRVNIDDLSTADNSWFLRLSILTSDGLCINRYPLPKEASLSKCESSTNLGI